MDFIIIYSSSRVPRSIVVITMNPLNQLRKYVKKQPQDINNLSIRKELNTSMISGRSLTCYRVYLEKNLFSYQVGWVLDYEIVYCMICRDLKFDMFHRRHHCRSCGNIVCSECSPYRKKVPELTAYQIELNGSRTCTLCHMSTPKSVSENLKLPVDIITSSTIEVLETSTLSTPRSETDHSTEANTLKGNDLNQQEKDKDSNQFDTIALDEDENLKITLTLPTTSPSTKSSKNLEDMKTRGVTFEEILKSNDSKLFTKVEIIKVYKDNLKQLFESNLFDDSDFRKANIDIKLFKDIRAARKRNVPLKSISPLYKPRKLLISGYSYRDLKELGFTVSDLKNDTIDVSTESALLIKAGYTKADLSAKIAFK